ncbi:MAG: metal-dependent transcriptional regulator [Erysipelotrichaceae bacterium]|jgi:Mn-dependent DtxR family transcriptional regulator|nr:metal-dependent transcriptional regulator [Erysipelotrichaceae bacterium]
MSEAVNLSPSSEDYLEAIYRLSMLGKTGVRSSDVASLLKVAKPSVNRALKMLTDGGWITQEPYALIYLTEEGLKTAESIFSRHRTLQLFLREVLKVEEPIAEDDACKMEHVISDETMKAIHSFMKGYFAP